MNKFKIGDLVSLRDSNNPLPFGFIKGRCTMIHQRESVAYIVVDYNQQEFHVSQYDLRHWTTPDRPGTRHSIFKYEMGITVKLATSQEQGIVIGRAHYAESTPSYLVRYTAGDGRMVETWWSESAVKPLVKTGETQ